MKLAIKKAGDSRKEIIEQYIRPETELEKRIIADEDWIEGAFWGVPRPGHPEGKIIYHIGHVLANVEKVSEHFPEYREDLRLMSIIHDTFKYKEESVRPRTDWNKHHAVYARRFAKSFIKKPYLLKLIELHDDAYYVWLGVRASRSPYIEQSQWRWQRLMDSLGSEHLQLYYLFFLCDTLTGDKVLGPIPWFEKRLEGKIQKLSLL